MTTAVQDRADSGPLDGLEIVVGELTRRFGGRLSTSQAVREQHGHTLTWLPNQPPDAVVFAETTEDVAEIVKLCAAHRVPVIAFGAGSSLEGHLNAPHGGVSVDLSRMTRIIDVHASDLDCVVEAGVTRQQLNEHLRDTGLFFPIDPGAEATLAGMAATRASGTNAVRYGTIRENVLNLTVVMASGEVIKTAQRARKSAAGYDLTHLLVGSEGTLGIITELTLRLYGIPETILAAVCPFKTIEGACNSVMTTIQMGLGMARIELLDALQVKACNEYSNLTLEETPTLFLEFHGSQAGAREQVETFREIAEGEGAGELEWAEHEEDRNKLWKARHDVYWSARGLRPGAEPVVTDVCVPISRLAECVSETEADLERSNLLAPLVGHVGDGNFHLEILIDRNDPDEVQTMEAFLERLVQRALAMEGTCTGEHGIGAGKMHFLEEELGSAVDVMAAIKRSLDPLNILNPGKIVRI
jgi:D-lactate dehydrogenase (cytochrome)